MGEYSDYNPFHDLANELHDIFDEEHDVTPDDHNDPDAEDEENLSEDEEIIRITVHIPIADHVQADWKRVRMRKVD